MSGSTFNWLTHLWYVFFVGKKLLPYERLVLDGWRASLPEDAQSILDEQLEAVLFIQHQAGGAKVCFYYREDRCTQLFKIDLPDLHAATVSLRANGVETLSVKIFIQRGRFFSIEFPKRASRYMQQHHMDDQTLKVASVQNHVAII